MPERPNRPRVVVVGPVPPPAYGVATATDLILRSDLLRDRFELLHLDTSDRRTVANMGRIDFVNVYLGLKHLATLKLLLLTKRPALVYLTLSQNKVALVRDWLFVKVSRLLGSRVVAHLRGSGYADLYQRGPGWLRFLMRNAFRASKRVVVLGESLAPMALAIDNAAAVDVVPNGSPSAEPSAPTVPGRVVFLGALRASKGLWDALAVADAVRREVPEASFVLAGQWGGAADRSVAEEFVAAHGLEGSVEFPGAVTGEAKRDLLSSAAVYLLPSHAEGHPWSVIEAMSLGVPVVATRTGAVPDTVVDGDTGFLAQVGDVATMAAAVTRLLRDEDARSALGRAGKERHGSLFTEARCHERLARVFEQAVSG